MRTFFAGEVLMRLECPDHKRFTQTDGFRIQYTGAELNGAVTMHCMGADGLELLTAVPDNAIGEAALNAANHWGISTKYCVRKPGRLGTFYLEQGFGMRPSGVIYDRAGSAFALSQWADYGFGTLFREGDWLYVCGTMPALNAEMTALTKRLFRTAKEQGATVCFDLNYRSALWSFEAASKVFAELLADVDILTGNENLAKNALKTAPADLCRVFGLKAAALTRRVETSAVENLCSGVIHAADGTVAESREYQAQMLDRVGGGDAFSGAAVFGLQRGWTAEKTVEFAVAAMVLKQTMAGDFGLSTMKEIEDFAAGAGVSVRR